MKKPLIFLYFFCLITFLSQAQTPDTLKTKLSKEWILKKYEQFGVVDDPIEEQKNDKLHFKSDLTCEIVENGKKYSGTWMVDKTKTYIICKLSDGAVKRQYKIISVNGNNAIFEYQSPDLIRTKYHMEAK